MRKSGMVPGYAPFSARLWAEKEFIKWCEENGAAKSVSSMLAFLAIRGLVNEDRLMSEYKNAGRISDDT